MAVVVLLLICFLSLTVAHEVVPTSSKARVVGEIVRGGLVPLMAMTTSAFGLPRPSVGAASIGSERFLLSRLESYDATAYRPGLTISDIFYSKEFEGKWSASSRLSGFDAPLGEEYFGGKAAIAKAEAERTNPLIYECLFRGTTGATIIADRLYNVESIARASMGSESVVDDSQSPGAGSGINRLHLLISPSAAQGLLFDIILQVTDREQFISPLSLCALERTVQTIRSNRNNLTSSKAIETITSYSVKSNNIILAKQRTASFIENKDSHYDDYVQREPLLSKMAYDVRQYEVVYTRIV